MQFIVVNKMPGKYRNKKSLKLGIKKIFTDVDILLYKSELSNSRPNRAELLIL